MMIPAGIEPAPLPDVEAPHRGTVERVIAAMRERVDYRFSLEVMAELAHLSPYYFARTFRQITGIPPGEFLGALRIEKAKQLLLTTDLSVGEICFEVGYNSIGTFTTRFTQLVGLPPGRMRRLPEELYTILSRTGQSYRTLTPATSTDTGVPFRIGGSDLGGAWLFVGLFSSAIPQGRPVAGKILTAPGLDRLVPVPDGCYHLMAAALPHSEDPLKFLLPGAALRVGRGQRPLPVRAGRTSSRVDVEMRLPQITDPPVLIALPALLLERFST
jgi:AraC family transcriptional regulator